MTRALTDGWTTLRSALRHFVSGPQALAFLPALSLGAYWLGGETVLIATALGLPLLVLAVGGPTQSVTAAPSPDINGGIVSSTKASELVGRAVADAHGANIAAACLVLEIDGLQQVAQQAGDPAADTLRDLTLTRLRAQIRNGDSAVRTGDARFLVVLAPNSRLDVETLMELATRLQSATEEPASIDGTMRYFSVSVGFCSSLRLKGTVTGDRLLQAAQIALNEAVHRGPSAIRGWTETIADEHHGRRMLLTEVRRALGSGQIQPWFQPQICTSTGRISGAEALARWIHPDRGIVAPGQFLRCLEEAGQMASLSTVVLQHSLTALRSWDEAGIDVPRVSVNFSAAELRAPNVVERIKWELDRFGLPPHRLGIEVLENVITADTDGAIGRHVQELATLGCFIELDDFGAGHASLTSIANLRVDRLKIDRSYVSRIDRDETQRRMLAAVLSFSERLGLETIAEGVETVGEHALLAQLGCAHVQGFGIARPMPPDRLVAWAGDHSSRIAEAQRLGRGTG